MIRFLRELFGVMITADAKLALAAKLVAWIGLFFGSQLLPDAPVALGWSLTWSGLAARLAVAALLICVGVAYERTTAPRLTIKGLEFDKAYRAFRLRVRKQKGGSSKPAVFAAEMRTAKGNRIHEDLLPVELEPTHHQEEYWRESEGTFGVFRVPDPGEIVIMCKSTSYLTLPVGSSFWLRLEVRNDARSRPRSFWFRLRKTRGKQPYRPSCETPEFAKSRAGRQLGRS